MFIKYRVLDEADGSVKVDLQIEELILTDLGKWMYFGYCNISFS